MATEPDDIAVDAGTPANDDRIQELVGGHRSQFEAKQSIAQLPKKSPGTCRMVVEFPFDFSREFLQRQGKKLQGRPFVDGVEYLRYLQADWENDMTTISKLHNLSIKHSDNGVRWTAAK